MKHTFLFFSLLLTCLINAQNLVPNPSFEEYTDCPDDLSQITNLIGCTSFNGSPDSYNICANNDLAGIPLNATGFQYPLDQDGYAGFIGISYNNDREVIGIELTEPLEIGEQYHLTMNIVRAFGGPAHQNCDCANSHLGARLFTTSFLGDGFNDAPMDDFAHVYTEEVISDSVNWTNISGWITADSAYTYLALGVFHNLENIAAEYYNQEEILKTYYFVDGVCLAKDPADCEPFTQVGEQDVTESMRIFPNPVKDHLSVRLDSYPEEIAILDYTGKRVYSNSNIKKKEFQVDLSLIAQGVYVLVVIDENGRVQTTQFIKS